VESIREIVVIALCVVVVLAAALPMVFVWRDDHRGRDR
jgi:hypothetical protein